MQIFWRDDGMTIPRCRSPGRAAILSLLSLRVITVSAAGAEHDHCARDGVVLQVLGSGGPELQDRRASTSYLLWQDGVARVLIDSGGGSALRFGESGANVSALDLILLTHLHVDHTADLAALVKSSFFEDRRKRLPLYGPGGNADFPATTQFVHQLFGAPDGAYRYLSDFVQPGARDTYLLEVHDLILKKQELRLMDIAPGLQVTATPVIHGGVPAVGYRVEVGGVSIAFSGDTDGNNGNLERLARGVDVFVAHNAVPEGATGAERALHMPPSVIGRIARTAQAKRLVLSHRMLRTLGHERESAAAIRAAFEGPITFANDLDCFPIKPAGARVP
jgi:ribonuclease BN (tRNA processing enzyme)